MSKFIEHNGKKIQIPDTWEEFVEAMTMKEIDFNSIKRDKFIENSTLIQLIDLYFQGQYKKGEFILPELRTMENQTISIFSDYGGEHKTSKYNSYSFLFCGWNHSWYAGEEFEKIRLQYGLDKKEISFKDLRFGPSIRALDDYLNALNKNVYGFLFTVLVDKDIKQFFIGDSNKEVLEKIKSVGLGNWKIKNAEKLLRILHIISYVLPLISDSNQKLFWMTDNDSIVANNEMFNNVFKMLEAVLKIYTNNKYKLVGGAVPFKERDVYTMDLLSITDLVAGCVEQYFTTEKTKGRPFIKEGAEKVLKWLATPGTFLTKELIRIYPENDLFKIEGLRYRKD
jgi:hypothetical protein